MYEKLFDTVIVKKSDHAALTSFLKHLKHVYLTHKKSTNLVLEIFYLYYNSRSLIYLNYKNQHVLVCWIWKTFQIDTHFNNLFNGNIVIFQQIFEVIVWLWVFELNQSILLSKKLQYKVVVFYIFFSFLRDNLYVRFFDLSLVSELYHRKKL